MGNSFVVVDEMICRQLPTLPNVSYATVFSKTFSEADIIQMLTPIYSWNTAKVGIKYQSINRNAQVFDWNIFVVCYWSVFQQTVVITMGTNCVLLYYGYDTSNYNATDLKYSLWQVQSWYSYSVFTYCCCRWQGRIQDFKLGGGSI